MGWLRYVVFIAMAFLAVLFGLVLYYHNSVFILEGPDRGFLLTKSESVRQSIYLPAFYVHIATGSLVLISGIFQLNVWIRKHYTKWHRFAGKFYAFVVLAFTAPSGLVMAFYANGGLAASLGFGLLAALWWGSTWQGFRNARRSNWEAHRKFMLRSYALTFSAVTLRMYSFLLALAGLRGESVYILIAWLSWVPSLLVVELWIWRTEQARSTGIKRAGL
jgi:hypothetical protein